MSSRSKKGNSCFFVRRESKGADLFRKHVCQYLTVQDMVACACINFDLYCICKTFTVSELLNNKTLELPTEPRKRRLKSKIIKTVETFGGSVYDRPNIIVFNGKKDSRKEALYHPMELPQIQWLIDECLAKYGQPRDAPCPVKQDVDHFTAQVSKQLEEDDTQILLKAIFRPIKKHRPAPPEQLLDVTDRIREMIATHGLGRHLILRPPLSARNNGLKSRSTTHWWWAELFGDPCPGIPKELFLVVHHPVSDKIQQFQWNENRSVFMKIRVA